MLAYLSVALFVVSDSTRQLPLGVLLSIPAPILLLQTLQMIWAAGVVARARSAELIEQALVKKTDASMKDLYSSGVIGSKTTTRLTDIRHAGGFSAFAAQAPYVGFYCLTVAFTLYVLHRAYVSQAGTPVGLIACVAMSMVYGAYIVLFALAALQSFGTATRADATPPKLMLGPRGSRRLGGSVVATAIVGVLLQAVQTEDPTPLYAYFTIWSAVASALGWVAVDFISDRSFTRILAVAGSIGSVLSGLVFWLALFPFNGLGTQPAIIAANVVLHLFLPIAIIARRRFGAQNVRLSGRWLASTLLYPVAFLAFVLIVATATQTPSPYIFLRPQEGLVEFVIFCVTFLLAWLVMSLVWRHTSSSRTRLGSSELDPNLTYDS